MIQYTLDHNLLNDIKTIAQEKMAPYIKTQLFDLLLSSKEFAVVFNNENKDLFSTCNNKFFKGNKDM